MSGTTIIRHLLATNASLTAIVPEGQIQCGNLPQNVAFPAISVKKISRMRYGNIAGDGGRRMYRERVQVTAVATDVVTGTPQSGYDLVESIMPLIIAACPQTLGTVNGVECHAIAPDIEGPDLNDEEALTYSQSQDFIVHFIR